MYITLPLLALTTQRLVREIKAEGTCIIITVIIIDYSIDYAITIWRFNSMATPGFQELFESRIKNYFSCTRGFVPGYVSKNYLIPPTSLTRN